MACHKNMAKTDREVLEQLRGQLQECLPFWIRKEYLLCECNFAKRIYIFLKHKRGFFKQEEGLYLKNFFVAVRITFDETNITRGQTRYYITKKSML